MQLRCLLLLLLLCLSPAAVAAPDEFRAPRHGVYVIAHRGAHVGIPENTAASARKAIELEADFIEIDVRTTKDGKIAVVHNATVDAYTGDAKGRVKDFTLEELQALDIGTRVGPQWKDERIPSFEELLDICQGKIGVYLDVKDARIEDLLPPIRARGIARDVVWYAGPGYLAKLREACPECIPMPDPGMEKMLPQLIERFEPEIVAAVWDHFSPSFVDTCHAAGALVFVDEDDSSSWAPALEWGADGIQTDDPERLIAFLRARAATP